jgi:O-antigen/teichoic acid export membrane protein
MAEFLLLSGMNQLIAFAVASWQGLDQAGAMRAAALLLGPASVLANGLLAATVPEGARLRSDPRLLARALPLVALVSAAVMVGWGVAVSYAPASVGRLLLGDRWAAAQQLVLVVAVFYAGANVVMVCAAGLRSLQDARRSLRLIAVLTVAMLVGGLVGASISTFAANVGLAVPAWAGAILAARVLRRSADSFVAEDAAVVEDDAPSRPSQLAAAGR